MGDAHVCLQVSHRYDSVLIYSRAGDVYLHSLKIRKPSAVAGLSCDMNQVSRVVIDRLERSAVDGSSVGVLVDAQANLV